MKTASALVHALDSRMNPIVVKELRQISRGKFLTVILIGFLFTQLTVTGAVTLYSRGSANPGPQLYLTLLRFLTGICSALIPAYAGFRLAKESSNTNRDLLFISTLKPASIVWGKTLSAAILAALIYSVSMPFIVMTYILRGIDLPSAFLQIALSYVFTLTMIQLGIMIGCMPASRIVRGTAGLIVLIVMPLFVLGSMGVFFQAYYSGAVATGFLTAERDALGTLGVALICAAYAGAHFLLSRAFISPPASNRAFVPRVYVTAVWAVSIVVVFAWSEFAYSADLIVEWMTIFSFIFSMALMFSISERDRLGARVRQAIPHSRSRRALAFLFYSGSAGGFIWASIGVVMTFIVGSIAASAFAASISSSKFERLFLNLGFMAFNSWTAAASAVLLQRGYLKNRVARVHTWLLALGIETLIGLLWTLYMLSAGSRLVSLNIGGMSRFREDPPIAAAAVIAAVTVSFCIPWIFRQKAAFKPLPLKTAEMQWTGSACV